MALKKHKLEVAIEEDFCLLGIVSDEPDYKLCWLINQTLHIALEKRDDLELYHRKLGQEQQFSNFSYLNEEALVTYRIIKNRSDNGYFLDELKNLDYLVHIQGEIMTENIDEFLQKAGAISSVRMCLPVDLKLIRNKDRLFLW
jgi:hypothetical protein